MKNIAGANPDQESVTAMGLNENQNWTSPTSRDSWDNLISDALSFGTFISWKDTSQFRGELDRVLEKLVEFSNENPLNALSVFERLIAGCLLKGQEVDDSGGDLGMYLDKVFGFWTQCCEAAGISVPEYIRKLHHWMKVDDMGYCHRLEEVVISALGKQYQEGLRRSLEERLIAGDKNVGVALKKLLVSMENTTALIEFCKNYGTSPDDCYRLALIFKSRGELAEAKTWSEKGLELDSERNSRSYELKKIYREILVESGCGGEALTDAWADFERAPSIYTYKCVEECAPREDHPNLRKNAYPIFDRVPLRAAAIAFCELAGVERLASRIFMASEDEIGEIFYGDAIKIAKALSEKYPSEAARVYIVHAVLILNERRSKAYHHAHDYLSQVKDLLERAGQEVVWEKLVLRLRLEHGRKSSFIDGFEQIVAGKGAPREPTFQDRIKRKLEGL